MSVNTKTIKIDGRIDPLFKSHTRFPSRDGKGEFDLYLAAKIPDHFPHKFGLHTSEGVPEARVHNGRALYPVVARFPKRPDDFLYGFIDPVADTLTLCLHFMTCQYSAAESAHQMALTELNPPSRDIMDFLGAEPTPSDH